MQSFRWQLPNWVAHYGVLVKFNTFSPKNAKKQHKSAQKSNKDVPLSLECGLEEMEQTDTNRSEHEQTVQHENVTTNSDSLIINVKM